MPLKHNKRSKAREVANKERRAGRHGGGGGGGHQSHARRPGRGTGYLSNFTNPHINSNNSARTFDSEDPLDLQLFDYVIVVDVEATCDERRGDGYPHEVIELPAVLIDVRRGLVDRERSFRTYIKPWRNPCLTAFCTELTGITQRHVEDAPDITEAIALFERWYRDTIPRGAKVVFAADGPWDFKKFLYECHVLRDHVSLPTIFYEYLDIRTTFARHYNHGAPVKLDAMLHFMQLRFEGRPHCGFDDAYNIARLMVAMMKDGCVFDFLLAIPLDDTYHYHLEGYPLYRREEGSGRVDHDVVDDIAKSCFGADYFAFGEAQRAEVQQYRQENPHLFKNKNVVALKRRSERAALRRRRLWMYRVLLVLVSLALVFVLWLPRSWMPLRRGAEGAAEATAARPEVPETEADRAAPTAAPTATTTAAAAAADDDDDAEEANL